MTTLDEPGKGVKLPGVVGGESTMEKVPNQYGYVNKGYFVLFIHTVTLHYTSLICSGLMSAGEGPTLACASGACLHGCIR